ncbi:CheF family chemotaxis protein [Halopelagius longus]|uniref:Chemotaxis protein CheF n=1 Tax=Halopelagius longus TaxID=1236180 RepID=A0A1H1BE21_9EURY|nr:CheF family chemotaxis protein [Halopelagius longus]RDI70754.1 chemotaxis protein CheF [Halopelagius longus]SDQ50209.1 HTH domain-containing protein [Halopelagius longus]
MTDTSDREIETDGSGTSPADTESNGENLLEAYRQKKEEPDTTDEEPDRSERDKKKAAKGESIVVDFVANFVAGGNASFDPVKGRVLMSSRRLILATSRSKTVIPITSVFDIAVGQVPAEVEEFFDYTVMVGYIVDNRRQTTVIGGDRDTIEKFSLLLFRAALNGSKTMVTHPAKVGGRVMDSPKRETGLHLDYESVTFPGNDSLGEEDEPFTIDLASVIFFEVIERTVEGEKQLVLSVQHVENGQTVTTEISLPSRRKMNVLGRYLRLIYHWIKSDARDVEVSEEGLEVLVGLYSTGPEIDLASLLELDENELEVKLEELFEDDLITDSTTPCELTPQGRFVVNEEIEDVNV